MIWEHTTLGDFLKKTNGIIQTGPFGSSLHQKDYKSEGIPVIMPKDIINDKVNTQNIARIGQDDWLRLQKYAVKCGDIIYPRRGEISKRALITSDEQDMLCGTGCILIRNNSSNIDSLFLNYFLAYKPTTDWLENNAVGSTMKNLSGSILSKLPLIIPPLPTQKRIASILSAYDDLIENNLKRIKLLEETAQNIYKEWFVNFRFPNYENTPINQETGLPEGWEIRKVTDFFDFTKGIEVGSANYEKEPNNEVVPFLRVGDISKRDGGIYVKKSLVKDKFVDRNDILISFDGSIGSVGYGLQGSYSSGLRKIVSKTELFGNGFMYCLVMSDNIQTTINAHAKGTTILHAGTSIIHLEFALSTDDVVSSFNQIANAIFEQLVSLNYQNQKLKEARDILLPRLMNRTIEV